jgi:SAM-dependent methyltransferase
MLNLVKAVVPRPVRAPLRWTWDFSRGKLLHSWAARGLKYDLMDAWDRLRGRSDPLMPPRKLLFQVGGHPENGERFLNHFRTMAGLTPHQAVLDVGCGVGRMALPLTKFLAPPGRYDGFDIMPKHVRWCSRSITPRFPNFQFQHADIFNREYNPRGRIAGAEYRFPYPDSSFDFAFLTSVFTHLLPAELSHYLRELGRVLKPGGRCFATAYILSDEATERVDAGRAAFTLVPSNDVYRVVNPHVPEACVAFDEDYYRSVSADAGFASCEYHPGFWSGRPEGPDFQDITLLWKPGR